MAVDQRRPAGIRKENDYGKLKKTNWILEEGACFGQHQDLVPIPEQQVSPELG
jgi:hypothetical protein